MSRVLLTSAVSLSLGTLYGCTTQDIKGCLSQCPDEYEREDCEKACDEEVLRWINGIEGKGE